jgi:hypothetical protein
MAGSSAAIAPGTIIANASRKRTAEKRFFRKQLPKEPALADRSLAGRAADLSV